MTGALWYLWRTTFWNRLRRQALRLKKPRYALAFLLGSLYFWFMFVRPGRASSAPVTGENPLLPVIAPLLLILAVGFAWIFGSDKSALAFTPAEVAVLFPAPVSRRALILYKLAGTQVGLIFTVVVWIALLRIAQGPLPKVLFAVGLWAVLSTYTLHRLGVALLRAGMAQHGAVGARRGLVPILIFAAVLLAIAAGLWNARTELLAPENARAFFTSIAATLHEGPAGIALAPLNLLVAPLSARNAGEWLRTIGPALLILGLHLWWVLRSDAAFEEAAAEASAKRAKLIADFKARRGTAMPTKPVNARRTLPLSPTGAPAVAILWKNALWLWRSGNVRGTLFAPVLVLAALITVGRGGDKTTFVIAAIAATVTLMYLLLGPVVLRNDLRADLLKLSLLKTLPLSSRDMVLVQVLGTATPAAVSQILLVLIGGAALTLTPPAAKIPDGVLPAAMIGAPALLLAFNAANFTIHNGLAVLFPSWVRLGDVAPGGVEAMGQMMIVTTGTIVTLALLLLVPVLLGVIAAALLGSVPAVAIVVGSFAAATALAGEAYLMIAGLARAYDRMEPTQTV